MLHVYEARAGGFARAERPLDGPMGDALWIDLLEPTAAEEKAVEAWLGIDVPTRDLMSEIEASSRAYARDGALFMTAAVVIRGETEEPDTEPVAFVLTPQTLVTVRYADPAPFRTFLDRCTKQPKETTETAMTAFVTLVETIVDRAADLLEHLGAEIEALSRRVFRKARRGKLGTAVRRSPINLAAVIGDIGRYADLAGRIRESLFSLDRLLSFFQEATEDSEPSEDLARRVKTLKRDVRSLTEHDGYVSAKVQLLLDATLGLVDIQQNATIKIFSVIAVVFMPPTLVASIYGMNFEAMPELKWAFGYPMALGLMLVSAVLPYLFFRRRGWL